MSRSLGYLRDAPDPRDRAFEATHRERRRGGPRRKPDLRSARRGRLYQGAGSACVGFALARSLDLALVDAGAQASAAPSPAFLYANARRLEYTGPAESAPPLLDRGCYPRLAMKAAEARGFCRWETHPYDVARINEMPPGLAYREAFDQRGLRYLRITSEGPARVAAVADALSQGFPVLFGMDVDQAFCDHEGDAPIESVNRDGLVGGHMMAVLAVEDGDVQIENWWHDWGAADGTARLTGALFGSSVVGDVYALELVPPFVKAVAA